MGLMCLPSVSNHATFEKQLNTDLEPIHNKGGCYGTRNQSTISKVLIDWLMLNATFIKISAITWSPYQRMLRKESLNNDGQQFHQYQPIKQRWSINPPITTKWTITSDLNSVNMKKTMTYDIGTGTKMWQG